ncbi:MAG: GNAT family N-acetyltransferase [Aggregatilineales bacterium]
MSFTMRLATAFDAAEIAQLLQDVWPHHTVDEAQIARVIPQHEACLIALDRRIVGLCDAFITASSEGIPRWEIDLLAVHPSARRQGIASRLLERSLHIGGDQGCAQARALVRVMNTSAERVFFKAGLCSQLQTFNLMTASPFDHRACNAPRHAYFLPVNTLLYSGIWIEGVISRAALRYARALLFRWGLSAVGALLPVDDGLLLAVAHAEGYELIGEYRWWVS